jgi:hypothetical protein
MFDVECRMLNVQQRFLQLTFGVQRSMFPQFPLISPSPKQHRADEIRPVAHLRGVSTFASAKARGSREPMIGRVHRVKCLHFQRPKQPPMKYPGINGEDDMGIATMAPGYRAGLFPKTAP